MTAESDVYKMVLLSTWSLYTVFNQTMSDLLLYLIPVSNKQESKLLTGNPALEGTGYVFKNSTIENQILSVMKIKWFKSPFSCVNFP